MRFPVLLLAAPVLLCLVPARAAVATPVCAGAASIWEFSLSVQPTADKPPIAVREVRSLGAGYKLIYRPGQLPSNVNKNAEVAVVLVPVNRGGEKKSEVTVLNPQSALESAEWESPVSVDVAALVYGPQGLDRSRVKRLVEKDSELISQLADYAEKTAQAEALIAQLKASSASSAGPSTSLDAAVKGISSAPGSAAVDRTAPTDQQLNAMLRGLNPAIAGYDPLADTQSAKIAQTAGVAARVAGLFFNNTVGLAVGSAALAENMRALMFPNMDFRSTFAQSSSNGGQTLCAKREAQQARTKLAYLWAVRLPNTPPPSLRIRNAAYLPQGGSGTIPAETFNETTWTAIGSVKHWQLTPESGSAAIDVPVTAEPKSQALKVDLAKANVAPGEYNLSGAWDWAEFTAAGPIHVVTPPDLSKAAIEPASSDRLVHGASAVDVRLSGADFEFVDTAKLQSEKPDSKPLELTPKLPKGPDAGPQETLTINVNPATLAAGHYKLALSEPGGKTVELPLRILPPVPALKDLPVRVNLGETSQTVTLKGSGLDRVEALTSGSAQIELSEAAPDGAERKATVRLGSGLKARQELDLQMKVEGMTGLQSVKLALKVVPARPKITAASMSRAQSLGIELKPDELPADTFVTYSVRAEHLDEPAAVRIACLESTQTLADQELRPGEKSSAARLERSGAGGLFLSLMPGAIGQPGCELSASVETAEAGSSDGWKLGRVTRLPKIERFSVTDEKLSEGLYAGVLEGEHLESISKVGWDAEHGLPVDSLPVPMAGDSQRQTLRIPITWPSPAPRAPLYVWLQGEDKGRLTGSRY